MSSRTLRVIVPMVALLIAGTAAVTAETVKRDGGPVTNVKTATENAVVVTDYDFYTDVTGMRTAVNVPAGQKALLVITFSGVSTCWDALAQAATCHIRVLVDGLPAAPGPVIFDTFVNDGHQQTRSHSMQFVTGPVSSGKHVVRVQYMVENETGWGRFELSQRTLTILRSRV